MVLFYIKSEKDSSVDLIEVGAVFCLLILIRTETYTVIWTKLTKRICILGFEHLRGVLLIASHSRQYIFGMGYLWKWIKIENTNRCKIGKDTFTELCWTQWQTRMFQKSFKAGCIFEDNHSLLQTSLGVLSWKQILVWIACESVLVWKLPFFKCGINAPGLCVTKPDLNFCGSSLAGSHLPRKEQGWWRGGEHRTSGPRVLQQGESRVSDWVLTSSSQTDFLHLVENWFHMIPKPQIPWCLLGGASPLSSSLKPFKTAFWPVLLWSHAVPPSTSNLLLQ